MAEVFGNFGNQPIELNNAATEATLRLLLQATLSANRQTTDSVRRMADRAGLNAVNVESANQGIGRFNKTLGYTGALFGGLSQASSSLQRGFDTVVASTAKFASGTGQASDLLKTLSILPGPFGLIANGAALLAQFQEKQLQSYRELTKAGVNFGGSLTDLKMAASQTYMTMDQFSNLVKKNSDLINRLGTTSDEGARAFVNVSKEFNDSKIGKQLRGLGLTTEEINEELLKSMALQGKSGLQNADTVERVQKSTGEYLIQLDALTKVTGVSKERIADEEKKAQLNAAYQAKLAAMAPEEQEKVEAARIAAAKTGVVGATDLFMSEIIGLVPQTKDAVLLSGTMPKVANGFINMANTAQTVGTKMSDMNIGLGEVIEGAKEATEGQVELIGALTAGGAKEGAVLSSALALSTKMTQKGIETGDDFNKAMAEATKQQTTQQESQAAAAAETEIAMKRLTEAINEKLMKVIEQLLPHLNTVVQYMADLATNLLKSPDALKNLGIAVGALTGIMIASKVALAIASAKNAFGGGGGAAPPTPTPGGGPAPGGGGAGGRPGFGRRLLGGLKGGIGGVVGGLGLGMASDYAKEKGYETAGAGLDIASDAATFAGTGALIGSVVPGIGTAVGGAVGGLAGAGYGVYKNFGTLFGKGSTNVPKGPGDLDIPPANSAAQLAAANQSTAEGIQSSLQTLQNSLPGSNETFTKETERLNKQVDSLVKYAKETAENTKRTIEVLRSLSGNLYPRP